jgi:hypothetical protein
MDVLPFEREEVDHYTAAVAHAESLRDPIDAHGKHAALLWVLHGDRED